MDWPGERDPFSALDIGTELPSWLLRYEGDALRVAKDAYRDALHLKDHPAFRAQAANPESYVARQVRRWNDRQGGGR